ncbi:MAG: hypothetical protein KGZ75_12805 [Syntrophomonadaceae bacterium]|nr:hypothetical protein [Syntrophomonadaceae bacterium]
MKILSMIPVLILALVLIAPAPAQADLPTPSVFTGREQAVYITFAEEDTGNGRAVPVKAKLQQDVHVLEQVFLDLHKTGKLDSRYSTLLVRIRYQPDRDNTSSPTTSVLSFTPALALITAFPSWEPPGGIHPARNLGRAYVIDTPLDSFKDLLALVLLLPRLGEQNMGLTVNDAETLEEVKKSPEYQAYSKMRLEFSPPVMNWGSPEPLGLLPVWESGVFSYIICDQANNKLFSLRPLDYYLARPAWALLTPRLIAAASETDLFFIEVNAGKTHRLDLAALFPQKYLQMSANITMAINLQAKQIYFTLDRNLPESFWQTDRHTYNYSLDTGEIRVAGKIAPRPPDPAPVPPPAAGPGVITEFIAPSPGDVSFVHQLLVNIPAGWHFGQISRHEGFLNHSLAELLPKDGPFVFQPAGLMAKSRVVFYGSQTELVLFDIIEERYHSLNLKELRPADYTEISAIRFAQNPNHLENRIYFALEGPNAAPAAYVWDVNANRVIRVEETLEDKQKLGWQELTPGAANHMLPYGSMVSTGNEAKGAISKYYLLILADSFLALAAWLLLLFFTFGVPFVVAHTFTFLVALKLKSARLLFGIGPALTTVLFLALSYLSFRLTLPFSDLIKGLVYPLPWYYHLGSSAGMMIMMGFIIAVTTVLTLLVFNNARILPRSFFQDPNIAPREGKDVLVSASAVYGLAGAVLLLLLFFLAATTLPYYRWPEGLDVLLFTALVFILSLAAAFYLLRASLAAAGYLTAAAAILALGYVTLDSIGIIRVITDYEHSVAEVLRQLFVLEGWLRHVALILPLTLICMVYLLRRLLLRRGREVKGPAALALAVAIAVPATFIILYGELLPWYVPGLKTLALPVAFLLFALTAIAIIAALVQVFIIPSQPPLPVKAVLPAAMPVVAPPAKKFRLSIGPAASGATALVVFLHLVLERTTGVFFYGFLALLVLAAVFCLALSSVYYLGRYFTFRIAGALFTPERVRQLTSKS